MGYLPRRPTYRPNPTPIPPSLALSHLVSQRASKTRQCEKFDLIKFCFRARQQEKNGQFLFWVKCEWKKESVNWKMMKDIPLSSSSVDEEGKNRGFWKTRESLNSNCNLPFERGEILFTTNYLPMCLCIVVSHSLIGSDPLPPCIWRSKSRMNAERTGAGCERAGEFSWTVCCSDTCWSDLFRTMLHLSAHVIM